MLITFLLFFLGLFFSGYALILLLRRRRIVAAGFNSLIGLPFLLVGGFFSMLTLNLQTYHQLTRETVLAEVTVGKPTDQGVPLRVAIEDRADTYLIRTKEWRLDARFVKWKPWMSLIGKEPVVRLERLEERGNSTGNESMTNHYELSKASAWTDEIVSTITQQIGLVDSVYGSSVYMPTIPGAQYQVTASISGLVARPINPTGRSAVLEWSTP
jgi:hypothetical protein